MKYRHLVLGASVFALMAGCATKPAPVSVAETIARTPQLSTLNSLVNRAGLADMLRSSGPYTVFAPTDEAFKAVPAKTMDELGENPAQLKALLSYHVLPVRMTSADIKAGNAKTAQGGDLMLSRAGDYVTVEEAMVQTVDIAATNGLIHTVDRVLVPPVRR